MMMKKQLTIEEAEWRKNLCPFEKTKQWKSGFSLKCPNRTAIYTGKGITDKFILGELKIDHSLSTCERCRERFQAFINSPVNMGKGETCMTIKGWKGSTSQRKKSPIIDKVVKNE